MPLPSLSQAEALGLLRYKPSNVCVTAGCSNERKRGYLMCKECRERLGLDNPTLFDVEIVCRIGEGARR